MMIKPSENAVAQLHTNTEEVDKDLQKDTLAPEKNLVAQQLNSTHNTVSEVVSGERNHSQTASKSHACTAGHSALQRRRAAHSVRTL